MNTLRPMLKADIDAVVELIDSHDEDDAEDAQAGFAKASGLEDHFVRELDGQVIGVCGFRTPPACEQTHWLSWTYVHAEHTNQGYGRAMITEILEHIKTQGGRKVFIKVSDYSEVDDEGNTEEPYAAALHLYQSLGFKIEITNKDYYDAGEAQMILGKRLQDDILLKGSSKDAQFEQNAPVQFNSVFEIAETDGSFSFGWQENGEKLFSHSDVEIGLQEVRKRNGRAVFLSFPSNYQGIGAVLFSAGFSNAGVLDDYFEDGIHEQHYSYYFPTELSHS